ncbi:MAG: protein kinase, partial [Gemmatimonadaceae bacterium]|nr:protein kinase [Gemmatimonadaceae bacterium]
MPHSPPAIGVRLASALGDRYVVEQEIGSGGMAIVFGARDVRHQRRVAIKVLRPELAAAFGEARFLREIHLAAGLQHPHILPIYDSGAGDGLLYYVMPLVEGEALSNRIARDGALPIDEAVRLAREIAGALGHAHERGIIHRDIKPDNVMLSGGHALVMDFGIARAAAGEDLRLTATGMTVGTPMYMSPEQALGSADVDARTDIYSLGCVLFEMLTGRQPFAGNSLQAILAQSITAPRPRVRKLRPEAPAALDDIVTTALAREPDDRYQAAGGFADALSGPWRGARPVRVGRRAAAVAACAVLLAAAVGGVWYSQGTAADAGGEDRVAVDARVIAVLPFTSTGGGGSNGEGVGEQLVDLLSMNLDGVGGIRVIAPQAVMRRWSTSAGPGGAIDREGAGAIGRALGAGSVLTGDIVTVGSTVRLSAELTSLAGSVLARAQADGSADSVLALVDSLSVRLLREVWSTSSPIPQLRVSALTTGSLPAMRAYLEGEAQLRRP